MVSLKIGFQDAPKIKWQMSPIGAASEIHAAQTALPSGPVTFTKAWIEMIHRYLAMTVGVLILVMTISAWVERWRGAAMPVSPWWPTATLVWVVIQGLFGKYTVTLKLYPAVVTLHLLGGLLLLVLLAAQHATYRPRPHALAAPLRRLLGLAALGLVVQIALGGWVSTNYAVLACSDFPLCNGVWWPKMDFAAGFELLRPLGQDRIGGFLPFEALVAIHMAHRLFAVVAVAALLALAAGLWRTRSATSRRFAGGIAALTLAQVATGLTNIVLDWPLAAALIHAAGAAGLVLLLALLWQRVRQALRAGMVPGAPGSAGPSERSAATA